MQHLFSTLGCLALAITCQAQATWLRMTPTNSPSARTYPAMAYDVSRQRTVLFGGRAGGTYMADTWEWDGKNWTQMNPTTSPPGRTIHTMVYDWIRRRTVLFGGRNAAARLADTWEWDGKNWTQINTTTSPPGRGGHAMAYNFLIQRSVVLGGTPNGQWRSAMPGVWQYDGKTWAQATTTTAPSDRAQHAMAHDSALLRTMVFGGGDKAAKRLSDTWEWDGRKWIQLTPANSPPGRIWHAMVDDSTRRRIVLFGGSATGYVADTWEWDGKNWTQINTTGAPSARGAHAMAYDSARQRTVLFGGTGNVNDTWEYIASTPLTANTNTMSIATGGSQVLTLNAGSQHGSRLYWLFGSLTGTTPGVTLVSAVGSVNIPLVPDFYTNITIALPNTAFLVQTKSALNLSGKGQASFVVPKITDQNAIGVTFFHAYLVYDAQNNFHMASNPVSLRLVQ
ncbi:MAG: Kelch repeat-containing protein [Planctomycetota bacterium]